LVDSITAGKPCGEIESTKSVSDLFAPADGEIVEVNDAAMADPALLNTDPFGQGWLFRIRITGTPGLLDAAAYTTLTEGA
jgi:glycine cleavage system H protein